MQRYKVIIELNIDGGDHSQTIQGGIERIAGYAVTSVTKEIDITEKVIAMNGYLANNPSVSIGKYWDAGFIHGAFETSSRGTHPSEIEGYAAGKLWAEEYDREV